MNARYKPQRQSTSSVVWSKRAGKGFNRMCRTIKGLLPFPRHIYVPNPAEMVSQGVHFSDSYFYMEMMLTGKRV